MDTYTLNQLPYKKGAIDNLCAVFSVVIIASSMFISAASDWDGRIDYINLAGVISRLLLIIFALRFVRAEGFAVKLYGVFLAWFILTRPLCRDVMLEKSLNNLLLQAVCFSLLLYATSLKAKQRKRVLLALSIVYCLFYFVVSVFSIYSAVTNEEIHLPLFIDIGVRGTYVSILSRNRNFTAQWVCTAFCLVLCAVSLKKPKKWQLPFIVIIELALYAAVAISRSKTSIIALAIAITMATMLAVLECVSDKALKTRIIAVIAVMIVVLPVSYKGADVICGGINKLGEYVFAQNAAEVQQVQASSAAGDSAMSTEGAGTAPVEAEIDPPVERSNSLFTEKRSRKNLFSLSQRVDIWRAAIGLLAYEPDRIYFGSFGFMDIINARLQQEGIKEIMTSTHNVFIEALMRTGIFGFILFTAFIAILVIRMIAVFFSAKADMFSKMLTVPLAATLVKNLCEASLIKDDDVTVFVFFLLAGLFLACSYELFPEKLINFKRQKSER